MGFNALIQKVEQAEAALEARERQAGADWRQVKATWRQVWTPGRIVIAGLVSGFMFGRASPLKHSGSGALRLLSTIGTLFAGGSAQVAAGEAEEAAEHAAAAAGPTASPTGPTGPQAMPANDEPPYEVPDTFRGSGQL